MNGRWNNRLAAALIVLLAGLGLCAPIVAAGCSRATLYCPVQRLSVAPLGRIAPAAVPTPVKSLLLVAFVALAVRCLHVDPLPASATARARWRRRYLEPQLPPPKPWHVRPPPTLLPMGTA